MKGWAGRSLAIAFGLALATIAGAATPPAKGRPAAGTGGGAGGDVAIVGGLHVSRAELEQRVKAAEADYRQRTGSEVPDALAPVLRRQVLESLIRRDLLLLEARRRGMLASPEEAEAEVKKDPFFHPNGVFDQARFDAIRQQQPAAFANAIQEMRVNLAARKLSEQLTGGRAAADPASRAEVARRLRRASYDALVLRRAEFSGIGHEPRESEVLAAYRTRNAELKRPERLVLSLIVLGNGTGAEQAAATDARADSALAALKQGASFDRLGERLGGVHHNVDFSHESAPPYWTADTHVTDALFATAPGRVLMQAVASREGLLLVRVDQHLAPELAPFREVAPQLRAQLRSRARSAGADEELRGLYATLRDSLRGTAVHVRWAVVDTATLDPGTPPASDVEQFYRAHLADYSYFDNRAGRVTERPLAEVHDDVVARWRHERRLAMARETADGLREAWSHGHRDAALERGVGVRELGPILPGAPIDSTVAGRVLADTLAQRGDRPGTGVLRAGTGVVVYEVSGRTPNYAAPFEQVRHKLAQRLAQRKAAEAEQGARRMFDADPISFALGRTMHYSRLVVPRIDPLQVTLTRQEVERWHHDHIEDYSAPEMVTASHILISPADASPAADQRARARADSLLHRLQAGEDFATLASQYTDDEATRDDGGDLGSFGRGAMLQEFETAAFALKPGQLSGLVKTAVGYHIIKVRDHLPSVVQPLVQVYANVGYDAARSKADSLSRSRADSLARVLRTPAAARALGKRAGYQVLDFTRPIGQTTGQHELESYYAGLDALKPGQFYPHAIDIRGQGWVVTWVDDITAPMAPTWEQARGAAIERWSTQSGERALQAKMSELDSLMHAGWSLDSVAAGFGGLQSVGPAAPGAAPFGAGDANAIDSLVFGANGATPLPRGQVSQWIHTPNGAARIRVRDRQEPAADAIAAELEKSRRVAVERSLEGTFTDLKRRYPVRILDAQLRSVPLPPLPPS